MNRAALVLRAGAALALAVLTILGSASATSAHAQLVASIPGSGERLDTAPAQLVLVFSERLDPLGTGIDVLDAEGRLVATGGTVDPSNARSMSLVLPALGDGLYTVNWRSLSADDGHNTIGFFNFGVGDVAVPGVGAQTGGNIHAGHGLVQSVLETAGRFLSDLGAMLAIGMIVVLVLVVIPTSTDVAIRMGTWPALALLVSAIGAAIVLPTAATSAAVDPVAYAFSSGAGELLVARAAVGFVGGGAVFLLARRSSRWFVPVAAVAGIAAAFLLADSGHAAGFDSFGPVVIATIHVASAGAWFAGLVVLSWLALSRSAGFRDLVRPMVPRFSAVALVSATLFILSGAYLWWLMNRTIIDTSTDYATLLLIKALLVVLALGIGGLNFLGWASSGRMGMLKRIPIEGAVAVSVIAVTALVASGSPPGPTNPTQITQEASSAAAGIHASLAIIPAQPGPNQIVITLPDGVPQGGSVELVLDRLDQASETTLSLAAVAGAGPGSTFTTDTILPAGSQWDASVQVIQGSSETGRARFGFSFTDGGNLVGAVHPPIDPLLVLAALFGALALLGLTVAVAGGWLPRANPSASRLALWLGSGVAIVAALCAFFAGPQL